jgi:hypothetical protein
MLIKLLKTYTISVTIQEGQDEFWEDLEGKSGCDEVVQEVRNCLAERGFAPDTGCHVRLEKFEERAPLSR